jgi:serine/threonine-protein kinase RsbW
MTEPSLPDAGLRVSLNVDIPSDVAYIERVVDLVRLSCAELSFNAHHLALNVPVALSEALSNAILRGNLESPEKRVRVHADVDTTRLVVEIADEGIPFDLDTDTRDATTAENVEREDGRGLFLMRKLMDDVERFDVTPGTGSGNVVRLTLSRA